MTQTTVQFPTIINGRSSFLIRLKWQVRLLSKDIGKPLATTEESFRRTPEDLNVMGHLSIFEIFPPNLWIVLIINMHTGVNAIQELWRSVPNRRGTKSAISALVQWFLNVDFQESQVTSDGGLILLQELDEQLGREQPIREHLSDS